MVGPKTRLVVAAVAVLAFGGLGSAGALAATAGWMVSGSRLSGSKALATKANVDQNLKLALVGQTVECRGEVLNFGRPIISAPNKGEATSLEFTECGVMGGCLLGGSTVKTLPVLAEVTLDGPLAIRDTIAPVSKTGALLTVGFGGGVCVSPGIHEVTGKAVLLAPTGQDERTLQLFKFTSESTLQTGSSPVTVEAAALLHLASNEAWSFL